MPKQLPGVIYDKCECEIRNFPLRIFFATLIGSAAALCAAQAGANSLGNVQGLPFDGLPYPYYYAYKPVPPDPCYKWQTVDTPQGPRNAYVNTCAAPVTAKY